MIKIEQRGSGRDKMLRIKYEINIEITMKKEPNEVIAKEIKKSSRRLEKTAGIEMDRD